MTAAQPAPLLIGLHGPKHSGKDTIGDYLVRMKGFGDIKFAGPLKDMLITFGVPREAIEGPDKEKVIDWIGQSPRELMLSLGTDWGRGMVADDIWIRWAERNLRWQQSITNRVVFTDCRFANEAAWIRAQGGSVWHVFRDSVTVSPDQYPVHISERRLPFENGDDIITNNGTLLQLYEQIDMALARGPTFART